MPSTGLPNARRALGGPSLLVGGIALYLAGLATWLAGVRSGPASFPLWALLMVTGFVASIAAGVVWIPAVRRAVRGLTKVDRAARLPSSDSPAYVVRNEISIAPSALNRSGASIGAMDRGFPLLSSTSRVYRSPPSTDAEVEGIFAELDRIETELDRGRSRGTSELKSS